MQSNRSGNFDGEGTNITYDQDVNPVRFRNDTMSSIAIYQGMQNLGSGPHFVERGSQYARSEQSAPVGRAATDDVISKNGRDGTGPYYRKSHAEVERRKGVTAQDHSAAYGTPIAGYHTDGRARGLGAKSQRKAPNQNDRDEGSDSVMQSI